jgi:hypothetical protein
MSTTIPMRCPLPAKEGVKAQSWRLLCVAAREAALVAQGRDIFRFDTFGDEVKWTDTLRIPEVIAAGVGPTTALSVGLKVDADALPQSVKKVSHLQPVCRGHRRRRGPSSSGPLARLSSPSEVWPHVSVAFVSFARLDGSLTTELGLIVAWDEEHTHQPPSAT